MKSDPDDPNKLIPPETQEERTGDLRDSQFASEVVELPKRGDRGIPQKKEQRSSFVNRLVTEISSSKNFPSGPSPASEADVESSSMQDVLAEEKIANKTAKKVAQKTASKAARKVAKKAAKKAAPKSKTGGSKRKRSKADDAIEKAEEPPESPAIVENPVIRLSGGKSFREEERNVTSGVYGIKRSQVKEINGSREVVEKQAMKLPSTLEHANEEQALKEVSLRRRRIAQGDRRDWGEKTKGTFRWLVYVGIGVISLVIIAIFVSQLLYKRNSGNKLSFFSTIRPDDNDSVSDSSNPEMINILTKGRDDALKSFEVYARSKTLQDIIGMVYQAERNGNLLTERWKSLGMSKAWSLSEKSNWSVFEHEGKNYGILRGELANFSKFKAFFRYEGDALKLDWKATTGYCSAEFSELQKGRGDSSEIRAFVTLAEFHTFAYPEGEFRSYRLISPDEEENLWGYTKIGSDIDEKLMAQFTPSEISGEAQSEIGVVLSLASGVQNSLPNQWIILKLVRLNWLDE
jgi:hypothetical protein